MSCSKSLTAAAVAAATMALAGCVSLAPRYERPAAPVPAQWPTPSATQSGAAAADIAWDRFFADARLRSLIRLALENNRDLRVAALNVDRARALYQVERAAQLPTIAAGLAGSSQRVSEDLSTTGSAYVSRSVSATVGLTSYELDLFGRVRSLSEQALQQFFATEEAARSTQIGLVAEVAGAWLTLATDLERLQLAQQTFDSQQRSYRLIQRSNELGIASALELRQAQVTLETARGDVARITSTVAQDRNALALLSGAPVPAEMEPTAPLPAGVAQVAELPAGVPSDVLTRRPDVLAAERQLQAANASIGAARAAFFPRISLTAGIGSASTDLDGLFSSGTRTWSFAPQLSLPIFTGGANTANLEATKVQRQIAVATYEQTIQSAFREVADALAARATLAEQMAAQQALVDALADAQRLAQARFDRGVDSYLQVLDAQRTLYAAQQSLVTLRLARDANIITLYKALGGGATLDAQPQG